MQAAATQFAGLAGARVIALDVNETRLCFCRERLGVEHTVVAGDAPLTEVKTLTDGDMPTVVFDATGSAASMMRAFDYVAHGG